MRMVKDAMTTHVVVVRPDTPFKELVRLLAEHQVSALPVVDENGRMVGIVSEADLMLKEQYSAGLREALWHEAKRRRIERAKARGAIAADVMTPRVVTIGPDASVGEAARRMRVNRVKRLPVEGARGRLVGIVSRVDLLKAFLRSDDQIRREVVDDVILGEMLMPARRFDVDVRDGVVVLQGTCERRSLIAPLVRAVQSVDGVVRVENRLGFDVDDTGAQPPVMLAH